jgi:hypothetical protein
MIDSLTAFANNFKWGAGGLVLGFVISNASAFVSYGVGYDTAKEKYLFHYTHQVAKFELHRDQSCMLYWFGDRSTRVSEARRWMCQYTNKKGELK